MAISLVYYKHFQFYPTSISKLVSFIYLESSLFIFSS